jgi:predicted  nucleic acid-binding Zn-ribbon protein
LVLSCRLTYKQINPHSQSQINLKNQGNFLGATAFEVWEQPNDLVDENSFHVLICLFPAQRSLDDITKNIANIYFDLNRLFCYRHKIIWAYHQSRKLKSKLKKDFHEVQQIVQKISNLGQQINPGKLNLQELQKTLTDTLTILSYYVIDLSYLDDQGRTIEVNLNNYKKRLEKISKENSNNQLQFLQEFSEFSDEKYLQQVKTDYINLSPGLTRLQNLISTIQGTIDIYQAKSDRHLEEFIGIAGVGLATSQIGSAVILAEIPKNQNPLTYQIQIFTLSLFIGLIFAALTYILLRSRRR